MPTTVPRTARLDLTTVAQHMHAGVVTCDAQAPLTEVAALLADARIHCVVVAGLMTTSNGTRLSWGTFTDRDLIRALDRGEGGLTAGAVAGTELVTVGPGDTIARVVQLMADHDVTHLVVVEQDFPVGVISSLDVARAASRS
jgi:CBS domain-containing protein